MVFLTVFCLTACRESANNPKETTAVSDTAPVDTAPETTTVTETDAAVTEDETDLVSETLSPTESETEAVTEAETEAQEVADGLFDSPTRLSGFRKDKNGAYLKGNDCEVLFDEDGSLILRATASVGSRYTAKLTVNYASMMKACCPSYTTTGALPNGGEDKYRAVVITLSGTPAGLAECDLYFTTGKRNTTQNTILPTVVTDEAAGCTYLLFDMGTWFAEEYLNKLVLTWGDGYADEEETIEMKLNTIELFATMQEACTALGLDMPAAEAFGTYPLDVSADRLNELIRDVFSGDTVKNETVMFLDAGDEKELLFDIDTVISVTSYDGKKIYIEGVDYAVRDGKLVALEGGSMPIITRDRYYGAAADSLLITKYDGKNVYTHWGEGQVMTNWQVNVTYTHKDAWEGFDQPCEAGIYADFIRKLQNGEDVTVIFYGDSCTYGAASSFAYGYAPYQYSYAILVTEALADLFDYTVRYVSPNLSGTGPIPNRPYVAGERGTITYINPSVGGWGSADALANTDRYLVPFIERYGCDLFISDIGGNDGSTPAATTRRNVEGIIDTVLSRVEEDVCVCIMSTLVNNPDSVNGWFGTEYLQEPALRKAAASYRAKGIACGNTCVTSMTLSVLEHVTYNDISGNNINHPNDFWARLYACTLFENLIGYKNLS